MLCPFCKHPDTRVVDSRVSEDGAITRRRRACTHCEKRFSTVETALLAVIKRSGVVEPFSREKVIKGVKAACRGRDVSDDALELLVQHVEEKIRSHGLAEIPSHEVGLAILEPLRNLDEVAYIRFASVYKSFNSLTDFETEIKSLRIDHHNEQR